MRDQVEFTIEGQLRCGVVIGHGILYRRIKDGQRSRDESIFGCQYCSSVVRPSSIRQYITRGNAGHIRDLSEAEE